MQTVTVKIGRNKGQSRIWLENMTLAKYGFNRGDAIAIDYYNEFTGREIHIHRVANSRYQVAGRNRRNKAISIIDICNAQLTEFTRGATTADVTYLQNHITIKIGAQS